MADCPSDNTSHTPATSWSCSGYSMSISNTHRIENVIQSETNSVDKVWHNHTQFQLVQLECMIDRSHLQKYNHCLSTLHQSHTSPEQHISGTQVDDAANCQLFKRLTRQLKLNPLLHLHPDPWFQRHPYLCVGTNYTEVAGLL